jgi:energy-coupling factor transporter ATP-binding protein EcfA2
MDTRIGGRITKGISGGQRRRVSICIEILTRPRLLFLDEPTSGLDSAASYHVMSHITRIAARERMTVVAAVHQPSGDVFELFHWLCLLAAGKTVFFGSISDATEVVIFLHLLVWCPFLVFCQCWLYIFARQRIRCKPADAANRGNFKPAPLDADPVAAPAPQRNLQKMARLRFVF